MRAYKEVDGKDEEEIEGEPGEESDEESEVVSRLLEIVIVGKVGQRELVDRDAELQHHYSYVVQILPHAIKHKSIASFISYCKISNINVN